MVRGLTFCAGGSWGAGSNIPAGLLSVFFSFFFFLSRRKASNSIVYKRMTAKRLLPMTAKATILNSLPTNSKSCLSGLSQFLLRTAIHRSTRNELTGSQHSDSIKGSYNAPYFLVYSIERKLDPGQELQEEPDPLQK